MGSKKKAKKKVVKKKASKKVTKKRASSSRKAKKTRPAKTSKEPIAAETSIENKVDDQPETMAAEIDEAEESFDDMSEEIPEDGEPSGNA